MKLKNDKIVDKFVVIEDYQQEIEQTIDMLKLRIKNDSEQKFVKNYMNTIKEGEQVLNRDIEVDRHFEQMILSLKIQAPFFNYYIS